jgi:site-specific DNA recombinase
LNTATRFFLKGNFAIKWHHSDYLHKQKLQNLLFPQGISYDRQKDESRTLRTNSAFLSIAELTRLLEGFKMKNPDDGSGCSGWVEARRVELLSKHILQ